MPQGRTLDLLLRTIDSCDPAIQADGALPPATYVESISYTTSWKTASVSRAQRDLAHLIRLCPNLKRLRLDGVFFHLPSFFTTLTQNTSLHELRLENLASHICAEDINTVLASQPQLKSFRLISDLFEDVRDKSGRRGAHLQTWWLTLDLSLSNRPMSCSAEARSR